MLKLLAETQFCTHFYTLESMLQNRTAITQSFSCQMFVEYEADEKQESVMTKVASIHQAINKDKWWKGVEDAYHVMMPVMYAIRNLDQRATDLGKVWMTW